MVVREKETGRLGTTSKYLEVPDLAKHRLTASSMFLFAVEPGQAGNTGVVPLQAQREVSRQKDLRYAAIVYNAKATAGQTPIKTQLVVTQGSKMLLQNPEEPLTGALTGGGIVKIGQLGLSKVPPGRYTLSLILSDPTDKKQPRVTRSIDFVVVE